MRKLYLIVLIISIFFVSCNDTEDITDLNKNNETSDCVINKQVQKVVLTDEGYLSFKDQESYNEISQLVDNMTDVEFAVWEKSFGFKSAQSLMSKVNVEIEKLRSIDEYEALKAKYSDKLTFESDGQVRFNFYTSAWARILTTDGVMKIGQNLYKFEKDREYIIVNGTLNDTYNPEVLSNISICRTYFPNKNNLKSLEWGTIYNDQIKTYEGNDYSYGDSRLDVELQLISFNYSGYGYSSVYYTEAGFELRIRMEQQRRGWFAWYNNQTAYDLRDISRDFEYDLPRLIGSIILPADPVIVDDDMSDYTSSETNQGLTYQFYYYYFYDSGSWTHVEPVINNFNCTYWSRGVGYDLRKTISYSNN